MIVLTLDVDWAPDFAIDFVAGILVEVGVRATWFVTHTSPAIDRLRAHGDLFELGIHPNFLPDSTHGEAPQEILDHCLQIVPEARSMRTHGLVQSSRILQLAMATGRIETEGSLFLPRASGLAPVPYWADGLQMIRIPFNWEDDYEMEQPEPKWHADAVIADGAGLNVFDFHPVHVYLNGRDMEAYRALIERVPSLQSATPEDAEDLRRDGEGPLSLFRELVARLSENGGGRTFAEIGKRALDGAPS